MNIENRKRAELTGYPPGSAPVVKYTSMNIENRKRAELTGYPPGSAPAVTSKNIDMDYKDTKP
jgi:hypothetical protein